jgi:lipoprotein-releasing system permease protein
MNFPLFVARRYFFAKQSKSIIQIITWIAVLGLAVSTAAMVIVLSAFNGIESIVHKLYSDFDPEITIESAKSKTFDSSFFPWEKLEKSNEIKAYSKIIEEVVVIKKGEKIGYANLIGAEKSLLEMIALANHIEQGEESKTLAENEAIMGIGLISKLDFFVFKDAPERVQIFAPIRDAKIGPTQTPFKNKGFLVVSGINYNREVNTQIVLVDFNTASTFLNYGSDITRIAISLKNPKKLEKVKRELQNQLGQDYIVKTNLEKNEIIYKTSKIEKIIVFFILVFIFVLASFNMVASLTMMFIEKRKDMQTMSAFGLSESGIFRIFFNQGLIISFLGIFGGLILGYAIIFAQKYGNLLTMPNSYGEAFPVGIQGMDFILIVILTSLVGIMSAYLPVRYLVKKYENSVRGKI